MKYKILNDTNYTSLEANVNYHLSEGWDLHGDMKIFTYTDQNGVSYPDFYQAMVKQDPIVKAHTKKAIPAFQTT